MSPTTWIYLVPLLLFAGILLCVELGFRLGERQARSQPDTALEGIGTLEAAVFALLGLLLAFGLSGATSRLDYKRQLVVQEANSIGTAYLRLDLLPAEDQPEARRLFRAYLDARLLFYQNRNNPAAAAQDAARVAQLQGQIWSLAVASSRKANDQSVKLLTLPALNEMIDITTERTVALNTHLPPIMLVLMLTMALLSGLAAGFAMTKRKKRSWLHVLLFAFLMAITFYALLDLDYPRSGLIRLDTADKALIELRDSIQ